MRETKLFQSAVPKKHRISANHFAKHTPRRKLLIFSQENGIMQNGTPYTCAEQ